jgi:hypothetical protein
MKSSSVFSTKHWAYIGVLAGILIAGVLPGRAQYNTAFYLNTSSYSTVEGSSISGTVTREALFTGGSGGDWNFGTSATASLQMSSTGQTYPITAGDVTSGGNYTVTIAANSYSANFTINFNNNETSEKGCLSCLF